MIKAKASPRLGFTLVEVLLAALILALLLVGIGMFFTNIIKQSDIVDDRTRGMELARQGLEEIRTLDILSMPLGQSSTEDIDGRFFRYFDLSVFDPLYPNARQIDCVVYWTGAAGVDTVSFSSVF